MELLDYKLDMSTMGRPMLIGDLLATASLLYEPMSVRLNPTATVRRLVLQVVSVCTYVVIARIRT